MSTVPFTAPPGLLLLCVDLQPNFLKAIPNAVALTRRCSFAIQAAMGMRVPVLFSEQVPKKLGGTEVELLRLAPEASVFGKTTFSALADPAIQAAVKDRGVEHLLLCGIETSVCVHQTAVEALASGLDVTVLSDCVGARRSDDAIVCLEALRRAGAYVLPAETVFYSLLHDTSHPFFKNYTQLVKAHA
jgi:nicotinamidase-related amidase